VSLVAYTSTLQADTAATVIGATHRATYTDLSAQELARVLAGAGLPAELAEVLADADLRPGPRRAVHRLQ
jgi:NAD(P)H dehydrogenase (quinone)